MIVSNPLCEQVRARGDFWTPGGNTSSNSTSNAPREKYKERWKILQKTVRKYFSIFSARSILTSLAECETDLFKVFRHYFRWRQTFLIPYFYFIICPLLSEKTGNKNGTPCTSFNPRRHRGDWCDLPAVFQEYLFCSLVECHQFFHSLLTIVCDVCDHVVGWVFFCAIPSIWNLIVFIARLYILWLYLLVCHVLFPDFVYYWAQPVGGSMLINNKQILFTSLENFKTLPQLIFYLRRHNWGHVRRKFRFEAHFSLWLASIAVSASDMNVDNGHVVSSSIRAFHMSSGPTQVNRGQLRSNEVNYLCRLSSSSTAF